MCVAVYCLLFVVCGWLCVVRCMMFVVRCSLLVVRHSLCIVVHSCAVFFLLRVGVCCLLLYVFGLVLGSLSVVRCLLFVGCCCFFFLFLRGVV